MKNVRIYDSTIESAKAVGKKLTFKDKLDAAKLLDQLKVDVIRLGKIGDDKENVVLVRTLSATVKNCALCCTVDFDKEEVDRAVDALKEAPAKRLFINLPSSPALLEYKLGKKPQAAIALLKEMLGYINEKNVAAEVCFVDSTSAEKSFLLDAVKAAAAEGVKEFTLCEEASAMLPEEFSDFVKEIIANTADLSVSFNVSVKNTLDLSLALSAAAVFAGADGIEASLSDKNAASLSAVISLFAAVGNQKGCSVGVVTTAANRIVDSLNEVLGETKGRSTLNLSLVDDKVLAPSTSYEELVTVMEKLGYALSLDDAGKVYEAFSRIMVKKGRVNVRELDALIATYSMQVPAVYKLSDYVINSGNNIMTTASVNMERDGEKLYGLSTGDGPIDAAFHAIESITGSHYELDEFKLESLTEGKDAAGRAIVKLRNNGIVYVGAGISTDIVGASIRAYVNALNKIVYGEAAGENR